MNDTSRFPGSVSSGKSIPLISFLIFLFFFLSTDSIHASDGVGSRFSLSLYLGGHVIDQKSYSDVLYVNGYRSVDPSDLLPDSSAVIDSKASFTTRYPGIRIGIGYRWSQRMRMSLLVSDFSVKEEYYCNIGSSFKSMDNLFLRTRQWQSDLSFAYILNPYPRKKKIGFQILLSGGISVHQLNERLDFRLPDTALSVNDPAPVFGFNSSKYGVSALFGVDAELYFNRRFSITPARLLWSLPVLRPSFRAVTADNGSFRRSLSGRNYETGGWFYFFGATYHF